MNEQNAVPGARRAIVNGGSGGLGSAIALELAKAGMDVVICGRNETRLKAAASDIAKRTGRTISTVVTDLMQAGASERAGREATELLGGVDVLVNCAGAPADGRLEAVSADAWRRSFEVKVFSAFDMIRSVLPQLKQSPNAVIVTLSGIRGRAPLPGSIIAGAMNAALENGMKALALDLARHRIRVLTVSPGPFDTERLRNIFAGHSAEHNSSVDEIKQREAAAVPLGRFGDPAEIGNLVAWLASEQAAYMTGVVVTIDGGVSPGY